MSNKNAMFLGLNYPGTSFKLLGCQNDVRNGAKYLKKRGYNTKVLIDKDITKNYDLINILEELGRSNYKTLFFHYSGHGGRIRDLNNDEKDGWDEVIFSKNDVTDDQIADTLMKIKGKTIYLIFDCCHSGTIVDLPYNLNPNGTFIQTNNKKFQSDIICISGCKDYQTSADVTENKVSYGALSKTLYDILKKQKRRITWKGLWLKLLLKMRKDRYSQVPQISVSNTKLFKSFVNL